MNKLDELKNKIHTVNPNITDELLDLLYEYITKRTYENMRDVKNNEIFQKYVSSVTLGKKSICK